MTRSRQDVMVDRQAAAFDRKLAVRVRHPQRPLGDRPVEIHDTAWNPASTKGDLRGPGRLEYRRYTDGGVTAEITKATTDPRFLAYLQTLIQDELAEEVRR
jgi:hypothetical protein